MVLPRYGERARENGFRSIYEGGIPVKYEFILTKTP